MGRAALRATTAFPTCGPASISVKPAGPPVDDCETTAVGTLRQVADLREDRRYLLLVTAADDVFYTHQQPVWRDRANFIIMAPLPEPHRYEQMWARQEAHDLFELCCIPFFAHDLALGDVVRTETRSGRTHLIGHVVKPSGRWTFRVWLGQSEEDPRSVEAQMRGLGALIEWSSQNLLGVDASDEAHAQRVADALMEGERAGRWLYETGRL